jgi:pimeloyl-ACP methyl ester carboxylesterase
MSGADDPEACTVQVGTLSLRVSTGGSTGTPLLLVNGLGAGLDTWTRLRDALGTQRVIAYDAPGTGGSTTPLRPLSMRELARVGLSVARRLGHREVDVLGYSFGGAVAQEMARAAPRRVRRVVLAATSCGWGAPIGDPLAMASAAAAPARQSRPPDPVGYWWQLVAISTWTSLPWLRGIRQPTLVLSGADDRVVPPAAASLLARGIPRAELEIVAGDHWFLVEGHATAAAAKVAAFLAARQPGDAGEPDAALACK